MGVNMPARTVVFDAVRKFDSISHRPLQPSEYIQMAGRAGRRGHDTTGTVIIVCKNQVPPAPKLRSMICDAPKGLESKFKVSYAMVLHFRRLSDYLSVEDMMRRSFRQATSMLEEKKFRLDLENVKAALERGPKLNESQKRLAVFHDLAFEYIQCWWKIRPMMLLTKLAAITLTVGRVLVISYMQHYTKLGILVGIKSDSGTLYYNVLVLSNYEQERNVKEKPEKWHHIVALTKQHLFVPNGVPVYEILSIPASSISVLTNYVMTVNCNYVLGEWNYQQNTRFK